MLFSRNSVLTGKCSHPRVCVFLPSLTLVQPLAKRRFVHHPTSIIPFRTTAQISHTAGGSYGDEFRPD